MADLPQLVYDEEHDQFWIATMSTAMVTLKEAAAILGLSVDTLRWQIHNGKLTGVKVAPRLWMVSEDEVERYRRENLRP